MKSRTPHRLPVPPALDLRDERGAVLVEYMAVWVFTVLAIALGVISLGPALTKGWSTTQTVLLANKP